MSMIGGYIDGVEGTTPTISYVQRLWELVSLLFGGRFILSFSLILYYYFYSLAPSVKRTALQGVMSKFTISYLQYNQKICRVK